MKLIKLHSGSNPNRIASASELMSQYVLGGKTPQKFTSGKFYSEGELVYTIESTGVIIYLCGKSDIYNEINPKYWSSVNIDTTIRNIVDDALVGVLPKTNNTISFTYIAYTNENLEKSTKRIFLPDSLDLNLVHASMLFLDGKYVSYDLGEYDIVYDNGMKYIDTSIDFDTFILYIVQTNNRNSRLVSFMDLRPTSITTENDTLSLYIPGDVIPNDYVTMIYINGKYVSADKYTVSVDTTTDTLLFTFVNYNGELPSKKDDITISVITSRSKHISISGLDISVQIRTETEKHRIDLPDGTEIYSYPLAFKDGLAFPYDKVVVSDDVLSIVNNKYYGEIGSTYSVLSFKFAIDDTYDLTSNTIAVDYNENNIPIPIINYGNSSDLMVFRKAGSLISRDKYYIDDGYMKLYDIDTGIISGDLLRFKLVNSDETISLRSKINKVSYDKTIDLPNDKLTTYDILLFTVTGTYIGKQYYTVSNGVITLSNECNLNPDEMVEIVYNSYNREYTKSIVRIVSTSIISKNVFKVPINTFDKNRDIIMVFNGTTGLYIDSDKYTVSDDGTVTLNDGADLSTGDVIDVYISRCFSSYIYISSISYILDII